MSTRLQHYYKKYNEWDKLWKRDVKELGFTRRYTDMRYRNLVQLGKGIDAN